MKIFNSIYKKIFLNDTKRKRKYLIKKGAKIGDDTRVLSNVDAFGSEPYLIEIGEKCLISTNVHFITHDGGISVLNNLNVFKEKMDKLGRIKIGNNVFIGANSIIMPGVTIGNNVIIGAGSIVTKNIESNQVACGIPAKTIKTLEEYKNGIKNKIYPTAKLNQKSKKSYCEKHI